MLRILRKGGAVGVLPDVNSSEHDGVFVPFFGIPACTTKGLAMLSLRSNAVIIPIFAAWNASTGRYGLVHGDIIEPEYTGDLESDIRVVTAALTGEIEKCIRVFPDQWLWIHKRWKTRPPGEKDIYAR